PRRGTSPRWPPPPRASSRPRRAPADGSTYPELLSADDARPQPAGATAPRPSWFHATGVACGGSRCSSGTRRRSRAMTPAAGTEAQMVLADETGPFFHGTKALLGVGEVLGPGQQSNFGSRRVANHVYFT